MQAEGYTPARDAIRMDDASQELGRIMNQPPEKSYELIVGQLRDSIEAELFRTWQRIFLSNGVDDISALVPDIDYDQLKIRYARQIQRVFLRLFILEKGDTISSANQKAFIVADQMMSLIELEPHEIEQSIRNRALEYDLDLASVGLQRLIKEAKRFRTGLFSIRDQVIARQSVIDLFSEIKNFLVNGEGNPETYMRKNIEIHKRLRRLLLSPLYWIHKDDENNPFICVLHRLVLAQYTEVAQQEHFQAFGRKILQLTPLELKRPHFSAGVIATTTWFYLKSHDVPWNDNMASKFQTAEKTIYLKQLEKQKERARDSEVGIFVPHDPRVEHDNTPGYLIDHELEFSLMERVQQVYARFVTMGVPVVGDVPAPEFCAALQAMENFQVNPPDVYDNRYFSFWNYVNLQNIAHSREGKWSYAIHQLNDLYPLSFRSISIAQNTPFMRDFLHQYEEWGEVLQEQMKGELTKEANFAYHDRMRFPGGGYFFPNSDRTEWLRALPEIVDLAFRVVEENYIPTQQQETDFRASIFKDLVNIGIAQHHQNLSLKRLYERGAAISRFVESSVCRGGIDRGASNTLQRLNPFMEDVHFLTGFMHGRPLLVARRIMNDHYAMNVAAHASRLPNRAIVDFLDSVGNVTGEGVSSRLMPVRRQPQ